MNAIDIAPFSTFKGRIQELKKKVLVVTDLSHLTLAGELGGLVFEVPRGEACKTRAQKEKIEDFLQDNDFGPDSVLVALGGGSIGDLVGFTAATYCRGIDFVNIPTTLLAMVDACLGNKTSINTVLGKNRLGAHWPAKQVLIDPEFTNTLSKTAIACGAVEMIKHGLIADRGFFEAIEKGADVKSLSMIKQSLSIKGSICSSDPYEKGEGLLLNFGHAVGHALEAYSQYTIPHGLAVGLGLKAESFISAEQGWLKDGDFKRIQALIDRFISDRFISDRFISWPVNVDSERLISIIKRDKKALSGGVRISALEGIGSPKILDGSFSIPCDLQDLERACKAVLAP